MIKPLGENIELLVNFVKERLRGTTRFSGKDEDIKIKDDFVWVRVDQESDIIPNYYFSLYIRILLSELMLITKKTQSDELEFLYYRDFNYVNVSVKEAGLYTLESV